MRVGFFLVPAALIASQSVTAQSFIGVELSQQRLFPGATLSRAFVTLSDEQFSDIRRRLKTGFSSREVMAWKASTGGWYLLDRVIARDDFITYALALDSSGMITGIEVLECQAHYDISNRAWLNQFRGKGVTTPNLAEEIKTLSGVSLSSEAVRQGVTRLLATYDVVLSR